MTVVHTPAQSRTIAMLHELATYPIIWPDGMVRRAEDVHYDSTPWLSIEGSGDMADGAGIDYLTVRIRAYLSSVTVTVDKAGRILDWDHDNNKYVPVEVVWEKDPKWPRSLWKLCVELDIEQLADTDPAEYPAFHDAGSMSTTDGLPGEFDAGPS